jgi:hypothetical protein
VRLPVSSHLLQSIKLGSSSTSDIDISYDVVPFGFNRDIIDTIYLATYNYLGDVYDKYSVSLLLLLSYLCLPSRTGQLDSHCNPPPLLLDLVNMTCDTKHDIRPTDSPPPKQPNRC